MKFSTLFWYCGNFLSFYIINIVSFLFSFFRSNSRLSSFVKKLKNWNNKLRRRIRKSKTIPYRGEKKRVSSPMINCANSVSSHKPFQKGQKSKSNYKYYQKILLDTKYLMKKEEKKENWTKGLLWESLKTKKTLVFELMKKPERKLNQIKKSLKKSFEKVLKSNLKTNKKYTKI